MASGAQPGCLSSGKGECLAAPCGTAAAGSIEPVGDSCLRAHMQRRAGDGRKEHIRGPRRDEKRKAEENLATIRAVAQGPDAWNAMTAEAHRLQERAEFEGRVAAYFSTYTCATEPDEPALPPAAPLHGVVRKRKEV